MARAWFMCRSVNHVPFLFLYWGLLAPASYISGAERPIYEKLQGWNQLVEAARREGTVVVYIPPGLDRRGQGIISGAFNQSFPGISVKMALGSADTILNKILTERRARLYIPDVLIGGVSPPVMGLKPAGALQPLKPNLILPEVIDESAWLMNRFWWADDAQEPYVTLIFAGYVQSPAAVNTRMANTGEFTSYRDFLNPKWKGKIVAHDIRRGGSGGFMVRYIYKNSELGPNYLERLFSEMDITLTGDVRQSIDLLGAGRFPLALFLGSQNVSQAQEKGLPVALIPSEQFKEGSSIAPGAGTISIMNPAPHPNAAKLFVNWFLSREGQLAYQESIALPSLRVDIPKAGLYPIDVPKPGVAYASAGTEEYTRIGREVIPQLVNKALAKAGRQ